MKQKEILLIFSILITSFLILGPICACENVSDGFSQEPLNNTDDYDKFMDTVTDKVTPEKLGEIMKFGKDTATQKQTINAIFDLIFDETLKGMQYEKDPNALATIQKYGGMEAFKSQIKSICVKALKDEQEAYNTGNIMRMVLPINKLITT